MNSFEFKLAYIEGLYPVVLQELQECNLDVIEAGSDFVCVSFSEENIKKIKKLRSIQRAYLAVKSKLYNPAYISKHKQILGNLVSFVTGHDTFKTFKIHCAGADTPEVRGIATYIQESFSLQERDEADLKVHIAKPSDDWEIAVQVTPRPLSLRAYKVVHMSGAMDPSIAYAMNSLCKLDNAKDYLNIFSGSATLLIEAAEMYPNIEKLVGFDNDKKHLSLSVQNIKKAGLIKRIQIKEADIFNGPDFGMFDVITSDMPFGMTIAKHEDLEKLYTAFVIYCEKVLRREGRLAIYTSKYELMEKVLESSRLKIVEAISLRGITNANSFLKTKILVCAFKG